MFYQGSLQEGISTAVDQQKLVLCFVTNESEESQIWENEYLKESSLQEMIQSQAVALRLTAGSEEAGYLAQIFPLPKTPTVVIMKHGELKEYIAAGTSKEDFFRRVSNAFNVAPPPPPPPPASSSSLPAASSLSSSSSTVPVPAAAAAAAALPPQTEPAFVQASAEELVSAQSEAVSRILAERAAKLKAQKEEAERKAKEQRTKAQEKAKAEAEAGANTDAARVHMQAQEVKKEQQKETEERKRILKRIEDDKAERRLRASKREQNRLDRMKVGDVAASLVTAPESKLPSTSRVSEIASLQVRLFDGSTIRSRFKAESPLRDVRKWVDENRGGEGKDKDNEKEPYTFKQVLTPLPNRSIDETEEGKALTELGLVPSSTLVLVPVQKYSSAYDNGGPHRLISRFIAMIVGFFTWLLCRMGIRGSSSPDDGTSSDGSATTAPRRGQTRSISAPRTAPGGYSSSTSRGNMTGSRGIRGPSDRQRDEQFYNGNSLNFEPRPDDDDDLDDEK